jgi:hypothetical protein
MTRKDYEVIADALNLSKRVVTESGLYTPEIAIDLATQIISSALETIYPNFRPTQFLEASGVK